MPDAELPEDAVVHDMHFEDEFGYSVQPKTDVTVSVPVPEGMDEEDVEDLKVYYIDNNGTAVDM